MEYADANIKLQIINQQHLLNDWHFLSDKQKQILLKQIEALDVEMFCAQKKLLFVDSNVHEPVIFPFTEYDRAGNADDAQAGRKLIANGLVGCILIAGGQATRLQTDNPKGMFPVTVIKQKSLFQLFAEKTVAASKQAHRKLQLAIMTSPLNHQKIIQFFGDHSYFGLDPKQVTFFSQGMLPFLDLEGNLFLDNDLIAEGPDGNGSSLQCFYKQGIWKKWHEDGIRFVNYVLVDNPLADPFDAELIGYHHRRGVDVTLKCIEKAHENEKVGLIVIKDEKTGVIEYTEIPPSERTARNLDGKLKHHCANLSLFSFSMDFIRTVQSFMMPLHAVKKAINGKKQNEIIFKFEKYIFDILPLTKKIAALLYPRNQCFSPLKNLSGEDSILEVQKALQMRDREIFSMITGTNPPDTPFELSQEFYYPTRDFIIRWQGISFPDCNYITDVI